MTEAVAIKRLETMPEADFQKFFKSLPARVQLLVKGGMVDWKTALPQWFIKLKEGGREKFDPNNIPF